MKKVIKIIVCSVFTLLVVSCSTKKDSFINRKYHSISTEYNVLYNGQQAFDAGLASLNANYEDNYWEVLPIEPLKIDELAMPGMPVDPDNSNEEFDRAEEKAVKAIQKHSMLIAQRERNTEIDAAYLLLGKSRYYSQRFVPALEAFNYIIINYRGADLIDQTRIWQAKTNVRLQNEDMAIQTLKLLLKKETLAPKNREAANTALAMAYSKTDSLPQEIKHLNLAVLTHYNKEQTARNLFILGQLYRNEQKIDSSSIAFQKIIDLKKAPYKYVIHAHIELAKNVSSKEEAMVMTEELETLIKDRYNQPYLDELYYRLGEITLESNEAAAMEYYKLSIQSSNSNNYQKELSYEAVGNLYFDQAQFSIAGAYYDSVLNISKDENTKRIRSLKRKRNNLDEVILYESIAKRNDSILKVVAMSNDERLTYFKDYISELKAIEKRKKEMEEMQQISSSGGGAFGSGFNDTTTDGKWYFYNTQAAGFGQQGFRNIWGNRILEDNWRLSDKASLGLNDPNVTVTTEEIDQSKKYDVLFYLNQIPTEPAVLDSISYQRNGAYYNLGVIYEAQFKETQLAILRLKQLLSFNPGEEFSLPAKYHLYKMYMELNDESNASIYKNDIITNYPNSQYAKIILNPADAATETTISEAEAEYAKVYYQYEDEKYESVIEQSTAAITTFYGQPIVPKFELLKAYAIAKTQGIEAFKQSLEFIVANYPNTEEGKRAVELLKTINSKI